MTNTQRFHYTLYTTLGCHLCDQAIELISHHCPDIISSIGLCDIATDDTLISIYGEKIPVLECNATKRELDWPFSADALKSFISPT